jgi:hypothetical protein
MPLKLRGINRGPEWLFRSASAADVGAARQSKKTVGINPMARVQRGRGRALWTGIRDFADNAGGRKDPVFGRKINGLTQAKYR